MIEFFNTRLLAAFEFAAIAHVGQKRKSPGDIPYISHPSAVGLILARAGFEDDIIIAGLLHDVIEDTSFTAADMRERFGEIICAIVLGVTEQTELPRLERKQKYLENLSAAPIESKIVSAADLLANRASILSGFESGLNPWTYFSKEHKTYAKETVHIDALRIASIKKDFKHPIVDELEKICEHISACTEKLYGNK